MRQLQLPPGFWWGTGNSSNQCEGAAPAGDWLPWEQAGHAPPSGTGNDFASRHAEDFALLKAVGLDHFRLSLEWARLEPEEGSRDHAEIERYRAMLQAGVDAGLHMWVTAHHFTLPRWFAEKGGFGDDHARTHLWPRHIEFLAEAFGDLVSGWKPINEPHAFALCGWLLGINPPGRTDLAEAAHMLAATHLANHEAWRVLRGGPQPVATIHNLSPAVPLRDTDDDSRAADLLDALTFDPLDRGRQLRVGVRLRRALRALRSRPGPTSERRRAGRAHGARAGAPLGPDVDGRSRRAGQRVQPVSMIFSWCRGVGGVGRRGRRGGGGRRVRVLWRSPSLRWS